MTFVIVFGHGIRTHYNCQTVLFCCFDVLTSKEWEKTITWTVTRMCCPFWIGTNSVIPLNTRLYCQFTIELLLLFCCISCVWFASLRALIPYITYICSWYINFVVSSLCLGLSLYIRKCEIETKAKPTENEQQPWPKHIHVLCDYSIFDDIYPNPIYTKRMSCAQPQYQRINEQHTSSYSKQ